MYKKVFKSKFNITNGKDEWVMEDENYDFKQEIARSAYADMLHDDERIEKYNEGLREAIHTINNNWGQTAIVLDIGTGTGILSMLAVNAGAEYVYACDGFKPAADCAKKIIEANGMSDTITVIEKRSTDLKIPEDLPYKCNILVTEVFDTELIGEGAINTFKHALEHLLEPGAIVVPSRAKMYIQPVESSLLHSYQHLHINLPPNLPEIKIPSKHGLCNNDTAAPVLDLQLSQLSATKDYKPLTKPIEVFQFDFMGREDLLFNRTSHQKIKALQSGSCHAFLMWWILSMDEKDKYIMSCRPTQNCFDEEYEAYDWRDHWMQAVYFPSTVISLNEGEEYTLTSKHDEYSLAFTINQVDTPIEQINFISESILHHAFIRTRFSLGRDSDKYYRALNKHNVENKILLCISDGSFLPFLAVHMGAKKVFCIETNFSTRDTLLDLIAENNMKEKITLYDSIDDVPTDIIDQIDIYIGEPYFQMCSLPWHNLWFWYSISHLTLTRQSNIKILPERATLYAMCVEFDDLHLIRQPVGKSWFDLTIYDHMIESARRTADEFAEVHSLWEYPSANLSKKIKLHEFDLTRNVYTSELENIDKEIALPTVHEGRLNGVAFWMEYQLDSSDETSTISCGYLGIEGKLFYKHGKDVEYQRKPVWSKYHQQGVHLPARICQVSSKSNVKLDFKLNFKTADMKMVLTVDGEDTTVCTGVSASDYFTRIESGSGESGNVQNQVEPTVS